MDVIDWIEINLQPRACNSEEFFYDDMESQSDYGLPVIYQPFDAGQPGHWRDRGSMYDFLFATQSEGKTVLDFGPGDGWPSLLLAPHLREVVGVDGSHRRVAECTRNARRLGLANARFLYVEPGCPLPFPDACFDGVTAASSIEQTPDPRATLQELYRVLRPGGRLRVSFEGLAGYRGRQERTADLEALGSGACRLTLYDRHIDQEVANMVQLAFSRPVQEIEAVLSPQGESLSWEQLDQPALETLRPLVSDARHCTLTHPSGATLLDWMQAIGFREARPTHSGAWFAGQLFEQLSAGSRPTDLAGVDALLRPLVKIVVGMVAPPLIGGQWDALITAVK
jgi:SAM-dependent methyltransferase